MANSNREMKAIDMYVVGTHMTDFARACQQCWKRRGRRQEQRERRMSYEKKGRKVREHSCQYLVGVSLNPVLVTIVVVTGELVIILVASTATQAMVCWSSDGTGNFRQESMNALSSFGSSTLERESWRGGWSAGQARHCLETSGEAIKW